MTTPLVCSSFLRFSNFNVLSQESFIFPSGYLLGTVFRKIFFRNPFFFQISRILWVMIPNNSKSLASLRNPQFFSDKYSTSSNLLNIFLVPSETSLGFLDFWKLLFIRNWIARSLFIIFMELKKMIDGVRSKYRTPYKQTSRYPIFNEITHARKPIFKFLFIQFYNFSLS